MAKLQKRNIRLRTHLEEVQRVLQLINSQDLALRQITPTKRYIYGEVVLKLSEDLKNLENVLERDASLLMR